jgi:hypothetical protein
VSCSTEVEKGAGGPVVVKRASGPDAEHLRLVGERLRAAAHPGVVQVLSSTGTEAEWELRLAHAGRPVDLVGPLSPEQVAGVAAAVATTLADLHAIGVVHGSVDCSHVLVGATGRPVLCGFGLADRDAEPADDVAALGSVMVSLLGTDDGAVPLPQRRFGRSRSPEAWTRRSLLLLADHACAEPATRRPSARRLAAEVSGAVPGATLDLPADGPSTDVEAREDHPFDALAALRDGGQDASGHRPRLPALACAVVGALVLGAGGVQLARPYVDGAGPSASPPIAATRHVSAPTTEATTGPPPICVPPPSAVVGGSACAAPVVVAGSTVLVGTVRYQVGEPDDMVALGDWDCDGGATPAVLRPSTGEVFVFSTWARDGDVAVPAVERVEGADDLVAERGPGGCARLVVVGADGSRHAISQEDPT